MTNDKLADEIERIKKTAMGAALKPMSIAAEFHPIPGLGMEAINEVQRIYRDAFDKILAALRAERPQSGEKEPHEALIFFVAQAFGDGFFDDDGKTKERIREWLLNPANKLRDDITIEEIVESMLAAAEAETKGKT